MAKSLLSIDLPLVLPWHLANMGLKLQTSNIVRVYAVIRPFDMFSLQLKKDILSKFMGMPSAKGQQDDGPALIPGQYGFEVQRSHYLHVRTKPSWTPKSMTSTFNKKSFRPL